MPQKTALTLFCSVFSFQLINVTIAYHDKVQDKPDAMYATLSTYEGFSIQNHTIHEIQNHQWIAKSK